jgi:hypothetical protein
MGVSIEDGVIEMAQSTCRRLAHTVPPYGLSSAVGKKFMESISQEFMQQFIDEKFAKAKGTRRAASSLAQTLQTLAGAPTSLSATMAATEQPRESPAQVDQSPPPTRIEPQRLSIGTGYAGAIWPM